MELAEVWAHAEERFAEREDGDMKPHAEAVLNWAEELMARGEAGDPDIVVPAAILHDVGIPAAIRLYGSSKSPGQEVEGAVIAREVLLDLNCEPHRLEAICGLVGVHHHRLARPTPEFRLIYDADMLVNSQAAGCSYEEVADRFYSDTARDIAKELLSS